MLQINEFVDERQKSWCIHCQQYLSDLLNNRDHVPSKTLLARPYPENLPIVQICKSCNTSFSQDEEYLYLLLESILAGSTDGEFKHNPKIARAFARNPKLKEQINKGKIEYETIGGQKNLIWKPQTERINRIILKNARGHVYYELGEPMLNAPDHLSLYPFPTMNKVQRNIFEGSSSEGSFWSEVGSRMMTRAALGELSNNGWIIVQENVYRYTVLQDGVKLRVKTVMHEYLGTEVIWDLS